MDELFTRYQQERKVIDKAEHQAATLRLQVVAVDPDDAGTLLFQYNGLQGIPGGLGVAVE